MRRLPSSNYSDLEDELLELVGQIEIASFLEARRQVVPGPYDIGLVEGRISTPDEEKLIRQARRDCRLPVSIGACATCGGIQALRNWADVEEYTRWVYARPEYIKALDVASPVAGYVYIDFPQLRGCPVNKYQLVTPRAGRGHGCTEAPRGILYHEYETDDEGLVRRAVIVPPTEQNQPRIEEDLAAYAPRILHLTREEMTLRCEQLIRNYDPCISCAAHFLRLQIQARLIRPGCACSGAGTPTQEMTPLD